MKQYLVLLRGGEAKMGAFTEEERMTHYGAWGAFMGALAEKGILIGGVPLQTEGRTVTNAGAHDVVLRTASGDAVGGYLLLNGNSMDELERLLADCPILEVDGSMEIRECVPMD